MTALHLYLERLILWCLVGLTLESKGGSPYWLFVIAGGCIVIMDFYNDWRELKEQSSRELTTK